jgi:hypothetical protein
LSRLRGRRAGALESRRRVDHDHANAAVLAPPPAWTTARGTVFTDGHAGRVGTCGTRSPDARSPHSAIASPRSRSAPISNSCLRVRRDRGNLLARRGWEGGPMQFAQDLEAVDRLVLTRGGTPALAGRVEMINSRRVIAALPRGESGWTVRVRQMRGQPSASITSAVVIRQRRGAGDCELPPSSANSICTMSEVMRAAIAKGSRAARASCQLRRWP